MPGGTLALSVNTIGFARLCGDNVCQASENYGTCAQDCRSGVRDGYCDGIADGTCDADCGAGQDSDCKAQPGSGVFWAAFAIVVVLAAAGYIFLKKNKTAKKR